MIVGRAILMEIIQVMIIKKNKERFKHPYHYPHSRINPKLPGLTCNLGLEDPLYYHGWKPMLLLTISTKHPLTHKQRCTCSHLSISSLSHSPVYSSRFESRRSPMGITTLTNTWFSVTPTNVMKKMTMKPSVRRRLHGVPTWVRISAAPPWHFVGSMTWQYKTFIHEADDDGLWLFWMDCLPWVLCLLRCDLCVDWIGTSRILPNCS